MEVCEKPLENSFVFGEKENEVQLQCTLFQGEFTTVIGSLTSLVGKRESASGKKNYLLSIFMHISLTLKENQQ
jgi:hypothetical protein